MTNPIQIGDETFAPNIVPCPACEVAIDAQRALYDGECPECHTPARALCEGDEGPAEDYEPESYKVQA